MILLWPPGGPSIVARREVQSVLKRAKKNFEKYPQMDLEVGHLAASRNEHFLFSIIYYRENQ